MAAVSGCSEDHLRLSAGGSCELTSECAAPLTCRLSRCRNECVSSRDCAAGLTCVQDNDGFGGCLLPEESSCTLNSECPTGLVCSSSKCTNPCVGDRDCSTGATCEMNTDGTTTCVEPALTRCALNSDCEFPLVCDSDQQCTQECIRRDGCSEDTASGATCHVDCPHGRYCQPGIFRCVLETDYTRPGANDAGVLADATVLDGSNVIPDATVFDAEVSMDGGVLPSDMGAMTLDGGIEPLDASEPPLEIYLGDDFSTAGGPPLGWQTYLVGNAWYVVAHAPVDGGPPAGDGLLQYTGSACETCVSGPGVISSPPFATPADGKMVLEFDLVIPSSVADHSAFRVTVMDEAVVPMINAMSSTGWDRIYRLEFRGDHSPGATITYDESMHGAGPVVIFDGSAPLDSTTHRVRAVFCGTSAFAELTDVAGTMTYFSSTRVGPVPIYGSPAQLKVWFEASDTDQAIGHFLVRSPTALECP